MVINYDKDKIVQPKIFLAKPGEKPLCVINGIQDDSCQFSQNLKQFDTLSFDMDRYVYDEETTDLVETNYYSSINVRMELFLENVGWFRINEQPTIEFSGSDEVKNITAESIESELQDYDLVGFKVNCGTTDSLEMFEGNYDEFPSGVQIAKNQIVLYSPSNKDLSLLDILCSYTKRWTIGHVDAILYGKIAKFDVDTTNIYSFLNNDISTAYECIVIFDYLNFTINVYSLDEENRYNSSMLIDTNMVLNFRGLQNNITMNNAEDLYTVYRVSGGEDLDIRMVNFGDNRIENISYFLNTNYVSQDFIDHYTEWSNYRESRREDFIQIQLDYQKKLEDINYIKDRVPGIGVTTDWPKMADEEILASYENYTALKIALENLYKDDEGNFDINLIKVSPDWADYKECVDYALPALENEIAIRHLDDNISDNGIADYDYDSWETDWDLYGLKELQVKIEEYNKQIETCVESGYDKEEQSGDTYNTEYWNEQHQNYLKAVRELASCNSAYNERQLEYDDANAVLDNYSDLISQIIEDVDVENKDSQNFHLTKDDLFILWKLRNEVDYTNENIITTTIDTVETTIEHQRELLEDAKKQLNIYSQVQLSFNISLDNLLAMYEYKNIVSDFVCGNYIRIMPYDDYQIKLRIIKISFNPLVMENDLQINFSNYLTSRNERTDKASLLSISNNIAKNSISSSTQSNGADITSELISAILRSSQFQNQTTNMIGNIVGTVAGSINIGGTITTDALVTKMAEIEEAQIERLTSESAFIKYLNSNLIVAKALKAEEINTDNITSDSGLVRVLNSTLEVEKAIKAQSADIAGSVKAENIDTSTLQADSGFIKYLESNLVVAKALEAESIDANNINTNTLTSDSGLIKVLNSTLEVENAIKAQSADIAGTVKAENIDVSTVSTDSAFMNYLKSDLIVANAVNASTADIATLATESLSARSIDAENIDTSNLTSESGFIKYLESNLIVADAVNAENANIANVATKALTADSIDANNIKTDGLTAESAIIKYLESNLIVSKALEAESIKAENIDTSTLTTDSALIKYLEANLIIASEIDVDDLKAKLATINTLAADSAFVNYLQSLSSTTVTSVVNEQYVRNLVAGKISVGDLAAGNIVLTDTMQILSDNGKMAMNGSALQITGTDSDGNDYIGIQLGYDTNDNPSLILRNEDGSTILTPQGITSDAVADGLIVNNMIHDATIAKEKLGFQIIEPNEQGGIDITQVYNGSGGNFGVEYTSFKNNTEESLQEIENKKMYRVQIESDNGNIFKNGDVQCILSCKVYSWDDDITDDINASNFKWTRKSKNTEDDTRWNARHFGGSKMLTLTQEDVYGRSVFYCEVTLPDGTTQISN